MIVSAAVRIYDKKQNKIIIIPCHRHADAFQILKEFGYSRNDYETSQEDQGFLTEDGIFFNRVAAKKIAIRENQIESSPYPELYSEDLW